MSDSPQKNKIFSTLLPPPNVTGILHLGHFWNATLQDFLIRYWGDKDCETYWGYGLDHAGISLQVKVEEDLRSKGVDKSSIGIGEFKSELWNWKNEHAERIREQFKRLGFCLPFEEERFTLDEDVQQGVFDVFRELFSKGLIYRAEGLINWDPCLKTAISDSEIEHEEVDGKIYHIKYFFENAESESDYIEVSTTRPETLFGDVAVFFNPNREECLRFENRKVVIPLTNRTIPILSDNSIDKDFGTGFMKCTPAHDFDDYKLWTSRFKEGEVIKVFGEDLIMIEGVFKGLHKDECRKRLVERLKKEGVLREEDYRIRIPKSSRSGSVSEPLLSYQWFLKSSLIAKSVLDYWSEAVKAFIEDKKTQDHEMISCLKSEILESSDLLYIDGAISRNKKSNHFEFFEDNHLSKTLRNTEDWCISRQLEWGIEIPAWVNPANPSEVSVKEVYGWTKSIDVLDTWFSSSLWPYLIFKHPVKRDVFFPFSVLISGKDILRPWISKMIFMNFQIKNQTKSVFPFKYVFLHGLVLDYRKKKMSKSLNNGIDPLVLSEKVGTDVMRLFFLSNTHFRNDIVFSERKLEPYSAFLIKMENASNFVKKRFLSFKGEGFREGERPELIYFSSKFKGVSKNLDSLVTSLNFSQVVQEAEKLSRRLFCSEFLEVFKVLEKSKTFDVSLNYGLMGLWIETIRILRPMIPEFCRKSLSDLFDSDDESMISQKCEEYLGIFHRIAPTETLDIGIKWEIKCFEILSQYLLAFNDLKAKVAIHPSEEVKSRIFLDVGENGLSSEDKEKLDRLSNLLNTYLPGINHSFEGFLLNKDFQDSEGSIVWVSESYYFLFEFKDKGIKERFLKFAKSKIKYLEKEQRDIEGLINSGFSHHASEDIVKQKKEYLIYVFNELKFLHTYYG